MTWKFRAGAAITAATLALTARADEWSLEPRLQWRLEANDNLALAPQSTGASRWARMEASATGLRRSEADATRLDVALSQQNDQGADHRNTSGHVELSEQAQLERSTLDGLLSWAQDDTADERTNAAELLLARTSRQTRSARAGWSYRLDELTQFSLTASRADTRYGSEREGADYDNRQLGAGLSGRFDERWGWNLQASQSRYAQPALGVESLSNSLNGGLSVAPDEASTATASLGAYRTRTERSGFVLACPLEEVYCRAGIVPRVAVPVQQSQQGHGLQYDLAYERAADERTDWRVSAARALTTSASGVTRNDTLEARLTRRWTPEMSTTWRATRSRDSAAAAGSEGPQPRLLALEASLQWAFSEHFTLSGSVLRREYTEPKGAVQAHSNAFSISLQYQGTRLVSDR